MSTFFPISVSKIFKFYNIPEYFYEDRVTSPVFNRIFENDESSQYEIIQISNRYYLYLNYLINAVIKNNKLQTLESKKTIISGIFAILYSLWDYNYENFNHGIEEGIKKINYDSEHINEKSLFVQKWMTTNFNKESIIRILSNLKIPFNDDLSELNENEQEIVKIIRDSLIYAPLYSLAFSVEDDYKKCLCFNILLFFRNFYGLKNIKDIVKAFNQFYVNNQSHEPYTEYTKNLINQYNQNKKSKFLIHENTIKMLFSLLNNNTNFSSDNALFLKKENYPLIENISIL